jgi:hypothetical protein
MKKLLMYFLSLLLMALMITACEDTGTDPDPDPVGKGSLSLTSSPTGAEIFINNVDQNKTTPSVITNLDPGSVNVTLKLSGYRDTTFSVTITSNFETPKHVDLSQNPPELQVFTGLKIYERASEFLSGVDLSTGTVVGSGTSETDLFYVGLVGNARVIRSQHLRTDPVPVVQRTTRFFNTSNTNVNDGEDSPNYQNTSAQWVFDKYDDGNYAYVYDQDNHYSKIKITGFGIDGDFDRWVRIDIIYNKTANDRRF